MSSINLTRAEAEERAQLIDVAHYSIELDLTGDDSTYRSTTEVAFTARKEGSTFLDLRAQTVTAVSMDGLPLAEYSYNERSGLQLNLTAGEHRVRVEATIAYSHTGQGLHRFTDPVDGLPYLYTQFETADAKRMFACFDQPDMKATYDLQVKTPKDWKVISNAAPHRETGDTYALSRIHIDYPLSTYLVALCAGPYAEFTDSWTGTLTHHPETPSDQPETLTVPLGIYARKSLAEHVDAERLFTETKQGFDYYHKYFGHAYPFGKYDQVFCPEYNMGAMENAGCVTIRDEYIFSSAATHYRYERRCDTILHELAHMWFGDLVTMQWWDDLWLNESFATWASAMAQSENTNYDTAWVTFANVEKSWAYEQDQLPSTHPIFSGANDIEEVEQNFDGITYAKGASVLKQLQAYVGREEFFAGVRRHFANHGWSNATFADLLGALEESSGRDLSSWSDLWLKTTGMNRLAPEFTVSDGHYSSFAVRQTESPLRPHRLAVGLYCLDGDQVLRTHHVELDVTGERTELADLIGVEQADLVLVNDDDLTYCLMELDEASAEFVLNHIAQIADPMARTLCWSAAWQRVRDGKMRARDFVALVAQGAQAETELGVLETVLAQGLTALKRYADPAWAKTEGTNLLADAYLAGAQGENPESALIFAQALAKTPLNDAAVSYFQRVLAGDISNLTVDADLRWWALTALIAEGAVGDERDVAKAIAQLATADPSASGKHAALRAEAALNTEENKAQVFAALTDVNSTASNLTLRHKGEGLRFTGSAEYLTQFDAAYFERAEAIWETWDSELALRTLPVIYPSWTVSEETIQRTEEFLKKDIPAGLRRVTTEELDGVRRTLRLRRIDAEG